MAREIQPQAYYPLFVDLRVRRCLVVGGGAVAQRKVTTLLKFGAAVTVVSPTLGTRLAAYARSGKIRHVQRHFRPGDLSGAWLVYGTTDERKINERVCQAAARRRIFVNIVDEKSLCTFIAPAVVKRGELVIAISTGGASPAMAKRLRRELQKSVGSDYMGMLRLLKALRPLARRRLRNPQVCKRFFDRLIEGQVFRLVRSGKSRSARHEALRLLGQAAKNGG